MLDCRPFYLPKEFTLVTIIDVSLQADTRIASEDELISCHLSAHLGSFVVAAGDFNHANLRSVMPKLKKKIKISPHVRRIHSIKCPPISQILTKLPHCRTLDFLIMHPCFSYLHTNQWSAGINQH